MIDTPTGGRARARPAPKSNIKGKRQHLGLISLRQLLECLIHALSLLISDRAQPIARDSARQHSRKVADNEPESSTADATKHRPEGASRSSTSRAIVVQPFLAHHLFKDVAELLLLPLRVGMLSARRRRELAGGIVLPAPLGVRKHKIGVVDFLELFGARCAGGVVVGDAVGVGFERGSLVGFADLSGRCRGRDTEGSVCGAC